MIHIIDIFIVVAACLAVGRLMDEPALPALERLAAHFAWGAAILGILFAVLGHVRLDAWVMTGIAVALSIAGIWRSRDSALNVRATDLIPKGTIDRVLVALIVLVAGLSFVGTLTPEVRHDPLFYHVEVPRLWLNFGRMVEVPENGHSYFPYGFEMLYAWALSLGSGSAAKALHWCAGLAAAGMTARIARAIGARPLHAGAVFYFIPTIMYLSTTTYIDLATAMFGIGAVALLVEGNASRETALRFGLMLGCAMSTKYTAWPLLGVPLGLAFAWSHRRAPALVMIAGACALVPILPWVVRNIVYVGNPVAPLLVSVFGPESARETGLAGGFDSFAGKEMGITALLLAPLIYAKHLFAQKYVLSVLGVFAGAALLAMHRGDRAEEVTPRVRQFTVLLIVLYLFEALSTRGHPDGRYGLTAMAMGAALIAGLCGCMATRANRAVGLLAPTLAVASALVVLFDMPRLQRDLGESWLSPKLSADARLEYLEDKNVIPADFAEVEEVLSREDANRVLGWHYPSREKYWEKISIMRNDLAPKASMTLEEFTEAIHDVGVTHIVRDENPGVDEEIWDEFLETKTFEIPGTGVREVTAPDVGE